MVDSGWPARRDHTSMRYCPSCGSPRVRSGYRPAPLSLRLVGFRELLCDNCNYLYRAFSPFPPKHQRRSSSAHKADTFAPAPPQGPLPAVMDLPKPSNNHIPTRQSVQGSLHVCPHCGSTDTKRRRRRSWERLMLIVSEKRPYLCIDCNQSFLQTSRR